jgi:hypothetical protein
VLVDSPGTGAIAAPPELLEAWGLVLPEALALEAPASAATAQPSSIGFATRKSLSLVGLRG